MVVVIKIQLYSLEFRCIRRIEENHIQIGQEIVISLYILKIMTKIIELILLNYFVLSPKHDFVWILVF